MNSIETALWGARDDGKLGVRVLGGVGIGRHGKGRDGARATSALER